MNKLYEDSLGVPNLVWVSGAIGGGFVLCALGIKSIFSQDISLQILDAQLNISNDRLELAESAAKVQALSGNTDRILKQLKQANNAHAEANQNLMTCRNQLEQILPPRESFPIPLPEIIEPVPDKEFESVDKELEQTQVELKKELDQIFDND